MKDFLEEFKTTFTNYKTIVFKFLLSLYSYFCIITIMGLKGSYSVFLTISCVAIICLFLKTTIDENVKKTSIFSALVCGFLICLGNMVGNNIGSNNYDIFTIKSLIRLIILWGGISLFFFYLLNLVFSKLKKVNLIVKNDRNNSTKIFFGSWIFIFILWLPYFLRFFPGILSLDSRLQLSYIEEGILMNNHPFIQTWFEGGIYNFGKFLFHNANLAMGLYTIVQMLILSAIFAYAVRFLYKHKFNSLIVFCVTLIYALLPQFAIYSVTLWKDVLFGGAMVLMLITLVEMTMQEKILKGNLTLFVISSLMILFFRNNGIYIMLLCTPFLLYGFRKNFKVILVTLLSLFVCYFVIIGPLYSYLKVGKSNAVESFAIPLQQVGRVIAASESIDQKEAKYLQTIFDFSEIEEVYEAYIVDPVKNHADKERLDKTKVEFLEIWGRLLLKHPDTYMEAYLSQTLGYWYPSIKYWTTVTVDTDNSYGVENVNLMPKIVAKYIDYIRSLDFIFAPLFWGIGLGFITMFLCFAVSNIRKIEKEKYIVWFSPYIGLWVTMMLAAPVFAEYRYVYGLFASMPIIILLPFVKSKL